MRVICKSLILALATLILSLITIQVAAAGIIPIGPFGGYNEPPKYTSAPKGPHGGYTTTSSKCKDCHAVHLATGSYMLTRGNSRDETCKYCHDNSAIAGVEVVLNERGHGLNATETATSTTTVTAPDDTTPPYSITSAKWGCLECHSVHDNQTVKLADLNSTKLLKSNPNPGKNYLYYKPIAGETSQTVSYWCSACHNANLGSHKDPKQVIIDGVTTTVYGHDSSGGGYLTDTVTGFALVDPDNVLTNTPTGIITGPATDTASNLSGNHGPTCKQCHTADGGTFPHSSIAPNMLKSSTDTNSVTSLNALDVICTSCHNTSSLP
ncbi:MAG TPA: cytochrome c3 family protein [Candidatus Aquicultor sp.]|jgi:hypothetical protein